MTELLQKVKDYLNISYTDQQNDRMLTSAIITGQKLINDYAGTKCDFDEEGAAQQLLLDYCRYVRSQATEMFEINYIRDLIALRENKELEAAYEEDNNTAV